MPILKQLDRLIQFHETLDIDFMSVSEFIYTNTAMALVLDIFKDNDKTPDSTLFFDRMCFVLGYYGNPVDIYDARLVPLRATRGFRVIIGAITHTFTPDTYSSLSLEQWWKSKHKDSRNEISDKLRQFGINHLVSVPDDWFDILHEQINIIPHVNPLLSLFTSQLWLPSTTTEATALSDYEALKIRAKDCVEYIYSRLIGEFDVNVLDTNKYYIVDENGYKAVVSSVSDAGGIVFHVDLTSGSNVKRLTIPTGDVGVSNIRKLVWEFISITNANNWCKQLERIGIEDMFD